MQHTETTISEIISFIGSENFILKGSKNTKIFNFKPINSAQRGDLAFCIFSDKKGIELILSSKASLIICPLSLKKKIRNFTSSLIFVENPRLWFLRCINKFTNKETQSGIHPTAIVESKKIGKDVHIGPFTYISKKVLIGNNCNIKGGSYIYDKTSIGKNVVINAGVIIGAASFGPQRNESRKLENYPHLAGVKIQNNVEIGANSVILPGSLQNTVIGSGTKISNLVYIGAGMKIGKNCIITGQTFFGGGSHLKDNVYIAPGAIIRNGITVGKNAFVGMGSVVTKDVKPNSTVIGIPANPIKHNSDINYIKSEKK